MPERNRFVRRSDEKQQTTQTTKACTTERNIFQSNSHRLVELLWIFAPGTGGNGTTRVDNLQVLGTAPGR